MTIENQNQQDLEWKFENDDDKELGIETKRYDNGQIMKRAKLSDGRTAVARRLKGFDAREIQKQLNGDANNYRDAVIARCLTINEQKVVVEDVIQMWMDDYNTVLALASINFSSTQTA
jgi:hypothetical protein